MSICILRCLSSSLIMMFRLHGGAGLSECGGKSVHMQSVGEERNKYTYLFLCLVQYGARSQCPPVCFKDFFMTFFKCSFMLMSIFNSTVQSIPCQSNNMQQARQCWVKSCWFCCVPNCITVHSAIQLQGETLQPSDITGLILELDSETHSLEDKDISSQSEWWHWQTQKALLI
jgi:hypothetical protein